MAQWIQNNLGGDIKILSEINEDKVKTPDYIWHDKMWDLKTLSSEKAANSAVRHGLKQISESPGGIFLNFEKLDCSIPDVVNVIEKRMNWHKDSLESDVDIIIVSKGKLKLVMRYKK